MPAKVAASLLDGSAPGAYLPAHRHGVEGQSQARQYGSGGTLPRRYGSRHSATDCLFFTDANSTAESKIRKEIVFP